MTNLWFALAGTLSFLLIGEFILWRLFHRRVEPLCFPPDRDASEIGFFRMGRLRLIAIIHTIVMGVWVAASLFILW